MKLVSVSGTLNTWPIARPLLMSTLLYDARNFGCTLNILPREYRLCFGATLCSRYKPLSPECIKKSPSCAAVK